MDHELYREWIDLAADGALGVSERERLEAHLASCPGCRAESERSAAVVARLAVARVAVRPGFAAEVVAALEPAPWEARTLRAWRLPFAIVLALAGLAAALFGGAAADLEPGTGGIGALAALADLFATAAAAGAGLLAASWRGLGLGVAEWLGESGLNLVAALGAVGGLNYLLFRLLRRRPAPAPAGRRPGRW